MLNSKFKNVIFVYLENIVGLPIFFKVHIFQMSNKYAKLPKASNPM
jgi:hypothetical protein